MSWSVVDRTQMQTDSGSSSKIIIIIKKLLYLNNKTKNRQWETYEENTGSQGNTGQTET